MQQIDAAQKYYGLFNRGVNTAVTGVPSKQYWCNNLVDGSNADEQPEFMQNKCAQTAELLGLHKNTTQMSTMSITAANLADGIRVDRITQKGSVYDVISVVTRATFA
ncbi:TPA: hypothetical protein ACH3X1_009524 [Trebouxia sp. C0004]